MEPGKIAVVVVVLEDVAAVEFNRFDYKTIHILFEYFIQKPHNCEVFFELIVFNFALRLSKKYGSLFFPFIRAKILNPAVISFI